MLHDDDSPIIFYQYFDTTDTAYFKTRVLEKFRETGHNRRIEFKIWNCYNELPGRDGDLFSYDCLVQSALCAKGFLRQLPEIISTDGVFDWMLDTSKIKKKLYCLPFITCCNAIICRKADYKPIDNLFDIKGQLVTPLKSMLACYYVLSFCNFQDQAAGRIKDANLSANAVSVLKRLMELMGGREELEKSAFATFDGIERFNNKQVKYLLGFTENLRLLHKDEYIVTLANFTNKKTIDIPLFSTDVLSVGAKVTGEKLLDCIDLIEIITAPEFEYDLCTPHGQLHYMLPANRLAYPRLIEQDKVYQQLFDIVASEDNCVSRFAKNYYEMLPSMEDALLKALQSCTNVPVSDSAAGNYAPVAPHAQ